MARPENDCKHQDNGCDGQDFPRNFGTGVFGEIFSRRADMLGARKL